MTDAHATTAPRTDAHVSTRRNAPGPVRCFIDSPWFFRPILALPALGFTIAWANGVAGPDGEPPTEWLLHPTDEFSARFMIITMMLTPLRMLFPQSGFVRWFGRRRRWLGVAAFLYAALHTLLYVLDMGTLRAVLGEALVPGILTGWLAFIVFVPLAATSNDRSVRAMGRT